jgi:hypothetical protein
VAAARPLTGPALAGQLALVDELLLDELDDELLDELDCDGLRVVLLVVGVVNRVTVDVSVTSGGVTCTVVVAVTCFLTVTVVRAVGPPGACTHCTCVLVDVVVAVGAATSAAWATSVAVTLGLSDVWESAGSSVGAAFPPVEHAARVAAVTTMRAKVRGRGSIDPPE